MVVDEAIDASNGSHSRHVVCGRALLAGQAYLQGALAHLRQTMKIAFIITYKRNNVVVLFETFKMQSFILTEVRDCDLLIVVTPSTFLKRKDMLKEKSR